MRRGVAFLLMFSVFFGVLAIFFSLEMVSAQSCPQGSNDIILRLDSTTNSHGEVFNGAGNYVNAVCYSAIFGGLPGLNPHACSANNANAVVRLSGNTNAHAEKKEKNTAGYQNVCYGNLACATISGERDCNIFGSNAREVIAISNRTNAHLETSSSNAFNPGFKVCCGVGSLGTAITDAEWQDGTGREIAASYANRTVVMIADTIGFATNTPISFRVWEEDTLGDDELGTFNSVIRSDKKGNYTLFLSDSLLDLGKDGGNDCSGNGLELFFEATVQGITLASGQLTVSCQEGVDPPRAVISSPAHREIYFANRDILFDGSRSEADGTPLTYTWTVEHNGVIEFTDDRATFTRQLTGNGMRTVTLRVTNSNNPNLWDEEQAAIVVLSSPGLLAYVNEPFHMEVIEKDRRNDFSVQFSAADSYLVDSSGSGCSITINCLAGNCPSNTYVPPPSCSNNISVQNTPQLFTPLHFDWKFYENNQLIFSQAGNGNVSGRVNSFTSQSNSINDKNAELTISYSQLSISEQTDRVFTLGQCISDGSRFIETDGSGNYLREHQTNTVLGCSGGDMISGNGNDCCPSGMFCSTDAQNPGCIAGNITSCNQYNNADDCNNNINNLDLGCQECYWEEHDNEDPNDDQCGIRNTQCNSGGNNNGETCSTYTCEWTYTQTECVDGWTTITYSVSSCTSGSCNPTECNDNPNLCAREPQRVPCGRLSFELPFFEKEQFILAVILISILHVVMFWRKK